MQQCSTQYTTGTYRRRELALHAHVRHPCIYLPAGGSGRACWLPSVPRAALHRGFKGPSVSTEPAWHGTVHISLFFFSLISSRPALLLAAGEWRGQDIGHLGAARRGDERLYNKAKQLVLPTYFCCTWIRKNSVLPLASAMAP
jgi:hypothetical protein